MGYIGQAPANKAVKTADIEDSAITAAKIADGTVVAGELASDSVTTAKILNANVTTAKLAADAVDGTKLADDAVESEHMAAGSVDNAHLAGSIATSKIGSGTFADARISLSSVTQHVTAFDDTALRQDITALALHSAVADNKTAHNLPNTFIEQFQDDTGIQTETTVDRQSAEYVDTAIEKTTETDFSSGYSFISVGSVHPAADTTSGNLVDGNTSTGYISHTSRTTDSLNGVVGDVGANTTYSSIYKDSGTFNFNACRCWSGHNNTTSPLGAKDVGLYTSADTTNGINGTWTLRPPLTYTATTAQATGTYSVANGQCKRGAFDGQIYQHMVLSSLIQDQASPDNTYADYLTFTRVTGIKGIKLDFRTVWRSTSAGAYTAEKPHFMEFKAYDTAPVVGATGTLISNASVASAAQTKVSGVMLYKDNAGTATIGTDLKIYFSCDNGSNWTEAASYGTVSPVFSTGVKMIRLGETTCTSGTQILYKAVWANQSGSSKETQLHGIGMNY